MISEMSESFLSCAPVFACTAIGRGATITPTNLESRTFLKGKFSHAWAVQYSVKKLILSTVFEEIFMKFEWEKEFEKSELH